MSSMHGTLCLGQPLIVVGLMIRVMSLLDLLLQELYRQKKVR